MLNDCPYAGFVSCHIEWFPGVFSCFPVLVFLVTEAQVLAGLLFVKISFFPVGLELFIYSNNNNNCVK